MLNHNAQGQRARNWVRDSGLAQLTKFQISLCHLNHIYSKFTYQLQRRPRRIYGPPPGDTNLYEPGRNQLRVALPPTDFTRQWPEIPRGYLKIAEELGSGAFGVVKKGYLMRNDKVIECAVKMLKSECILEQLITFSTDKSKKRHDTTGRF